MQPTLVFLPEKSPGQRSLAGNSTRDCKRAGLNNNNMGEIFMELSQSEMKISMLAIFEEIKDKTENLADD